MKKSRRTTPKKTLTQKQIKAALLEMGRSPTLSLPQTIVAGWTAWRNDDEWITQNPKLAARPAVLGAGGQHKTALEEHRENFRILKAETDSAVFIAMEQKDADFFSDIAAAISKQKRVASKLKHGTKPFDSKKFLLLKQAHEGTENVYQLAKFVKTSGIAQESETLDSIRADLFRRRKKLNLPKISSKG
jgi:hypothetical protein